MRRSARLTVRFSRLPACGGNQAPDHSRTLKPTRSVGGKAVPMSTNNLRVEKVASRGVLAPVWARGQRCLVPALDYDEPYYPDDLHNTWWRFARADGQIWALAGVWNDWTDHATGEVHGSYSMITMNCDAHQLLRHMHKPERDPATKAVLPPEQQDKRSVVPIERADWDAWLNGTPDQALALIRLPAVDVFAHGPVDPASPVRLTV